VAVVGFAAFHLGTVVDGSQQGSVRVLASPPSDDRFAPSPAPAAFTSPAPEWNVAAHRFVAAFLDHSRTRAVRLRSVASPRLATLLARTDPSKIPIGRPVGEPSVVSETSDSVTVTQRLSDGSAIAFDVVPDPISSAGWVVTSVRSGTR
jgi:hypothetical protein